MDAIRIPRRGLGRPRQRPGRAMADKAYSSRANRAWLRRHGIAAVIPVKEDQKKHRRDRGRADGRPPAFDASWYTKRNTVERCFAKLKQFRAVATRYDKRELGVGRAAHHLSIAQPLDPDHEHELIRRVHEKRDQPLVVRAEMQRHGHVITLVRRRWYCSGSTITTASMNAASDARTAGFRSVNCC